MCKKETQYGASSYRAKGGREAQRVNSKSASQTPLGVPAAARSVEPPETVNRSTSPENKEGDGEAARSTVAAFGASACAFDVVYAQTRFHLYGAPPPSLLLRSGVLQGA